MDQLSQKTLFDLGSFGWLLSEDIELPPCSSVADVASAYVASAAFGTRFLEPEVIVLHGPFYREDVKPEDFIPVAGHELKAHLEIIRGLPGWADPTNETEWAAVGAHVHELQLLHPWCLHLRITEESKDRQSEGGFEFWVFREYLFAKPNVPAVRRLVFAYE